MSEAAAESPEAMAFRMARRRAAAPGGSRDRVVKAARVGFPLAAFLLFAALVLIPLNEVRELSFLLSKDSAAEAGERLRVTRASYRGTTSAGEPFEISAASAVQKTSEVPVVVLKGLAARIERADGPVTVTAPGGLYFLETGLIEVGGPIEIRSSAGYRVDGEKLIVDLETNHVRSGLPVSGELPMGRFEAGGFEADLPGQRVVLTDGARMRLYPDRMRMPA
jgi:lipopolysaccharide export system protein LptC